MKIKKYSSFKSLFFFGLLSVCFQFSSGIIFAQNAPTKAWDKTFGGNNEDGITSIQQTNDGGFILGGNSDSGKTGDKSESSKGSTDYWIIKTDAAGNKLWDKTYGGSGIENLTTIHQTVDGGYFLCGTSLSNNSGDKTEPSRGGRDFWIVKIDAAGVKQWDKTYGGNGEDWLESSQISADGGLILAGYSGSNTSGEKTDSAYGGFSDYWIVKVDALGNKQWDKTFGGDDTDVPEVVKQTSDGGYIVAGLSYSGQTGNKGLPSQGSTDGWVIKLDAAGIKQWERVYGGDLSDGITDLLQNSNDEYILIGISFSNISGDKSENSRGRADYWLIKTDAMGVKQWDKTYGGDFDEIEPKILQTPDGGFLLAGTTLSEQSGDKSGPVIGAFDFWVVKTDANGTKQWDKTYGGTDWDNFADIIDTIDGGYLLAGFSASNMGGDKSEPSRGGRDFWMLKLGGSTTGITNVKKEAVFNIYPNPNNGKFKIQVPEIKRASAELMVHDLAGKAVVKQDFQVTDSSLEEELNLSLPAGLYFIQLKVGDKINTQKFIVN